VDDAAVRRVTSAFARAIEGCEESDEACHGLSVGGYLQDVWIAERAAILGQADVAQSVAADEGALLDAAWDFCGAFQCATDGCGELSEQGVLSLRLYDELDGKNIPSDPDAGGFGAAMRALAREAAAAGAEIKVGAPVVAVHWGQVGSEFASEARMAGAGEARGEHGSTVSCAGGEEFTADAVVLSVPLPSLRKLEFHPPLPSDKRCAMEEQVELGQVEKLFIRFAPRNTPAAFGAGEAAEDGVVTETRSGDRTEEGNADMAERGKRDALAGGCGADATPGHVAGGASAGAAKGDNVEGSDQSHGTGTAAESIRGAGGGLDQNSSGYCSSSSGDSGEDGSDGEGAIRIAGAGRGDAGTGGSGGGKECVNGGAGNRVGDGEPAGNHLHSDQNGLGGRNGHTEVSHTGRPLPSSINLLWMSSEEDSTAGAHLADTGGGDRNDQQAKDALAAQPLGTPNWTRGLFSLQGTLSGDAFVGWLTGDHARAVSGRPGPGLLAELRHGLRCFLDQPELCEWEPVACAVTSWCTNPYIGGSYSYLTPAAGDDVAAVLAAPLVRPTGPAPAMSGGPDAPAEAASVHTPGQTHALPVSAGCSGPPSVLFCGEATSKGLFGTVGGAMLSGEREAKRLLQAWASN
jgi:hypothetical protein